MSDFPPVAHDDPEFEDDRSIADDEILWRGLRESDLPEGPAGPISSAAFKTKQWRKVWRHISTYRRSIGEKELSEIWRRLPKSIALCDLAAGEARKHLPHVVGVCMAEEGLASHCRIVRNRETSDDEWQVIAILLAEAASVSILKDGGGRAR